MARSRGVRRARNSLTGKDFASAEAHRLLGFAPDEATHATLADFSLRIHPKGRPTFDAAIETAGRERADFEVNYRVVHPDGTVRHIHTLGHPMLGASGELREFIGIVMDVTERSRAEEEHARHARDTALRTDVSGVLASAVSMRGMLQGCAEALVRRLDVAFARIGTLRRGGGVLELQASAGAYTRLDGAYARAGRRAEDRPHRARACAVPDERRPRRPARRGQGVGAAGGDGRLRGLPAGGGGARRRRDGAVRAERLRGILALIERTGREARLAVVGMRERAESVDLVSAVQTAAQRTIAQAAVPVPVRVAGRVRRVPTPVRDAAVAIVHEAVTNVLKHAGARSVEVSVRFRRRAFRLSVRDDGRGLAVPADGAGGAEHVGIVGMRERAAGIRAAFRVSSAPGRGTVIGLDVPLGR